MHIFNIFYSLRFCDSVCLVERCAFYIEHVNSNTCKGIYAGAKVVALSALCSKTRSSLPKQGPVGSLRVMLPLLSANNE